MDVPVSTFLSEAAREKLTRSAATAQYRDPMAFAAMADAIRAGYDKTVKAAVERAQSKYAVTIESTVIGGVKVDIVTPKARVSPANKNRVLINLHGGAFIVGGHWGGLLESIPVAALGGYKVVTVDYRMAPEAAYPAASEDVATVYRDLLKRYHPYNIGLYGCSSGGTLTAQSVVWFARHGLPRPGAIGILCASLSPDFSGDSVYTSAVLTGLPPMTPPSGPGRWPGTGSVPYMAKADLTDAAASPMGHADVLKAFPPTLFITSSRAPEMSAAIYSNQELATLGVDTQLFVFEGLWHAFAGDATLPESELYQRNIVRFFDRYLGRR